MFDNSSHKKLLRFITCGSVDDGKSTLIGRLLHDTRLILDDQLAAVERDSRKHGTVGDDADLALVVDGLEAEREQGITIDVAYRYFSTRRRAFIAADTPGHEQYTRNMATGASTADLAILLVDARKGLLPQSRRHGKICALLGIRDCVLAINKMDLVGFSEHRFNSIVAAFAPIAEQLGFTSIRAVPLCARAGDNVSVLSTRMPWYSGPPLVELLETIDVTDKQYDQHFRFPVQLVNRPDSNFRGLAGTVASGSIIAGDQVVVAKSGVTTSIARIVSFDGDLERAQTGDAVTLVLADDVDVARGDVLTPPHERLDVADQFSADLVWLGEEPLFPGRSYLITCGTKTVLARVTTLKHKLNIDTFAELPARTLALNDIGFCNIATGEPLAFAPYVQNKRMGAFIVVDRQTNATVGAGMIRSSLQRATNIHRQHHRIDKAARALAKAQKPMIFWFTGLSGSGKSTIADLVEAKLHARGMHTILLDGDNMRHGLNRDLGFTDADRVENIRRVGEVAKLMIDAGLVVLCSFISPFAAERRMVRELVGPNEFVEIFVDVPIEECIKRDPKGLYARAIAGSLPNFTGINSPYEYPENPEIRIDGLAVSADAASDCIVEWIRRHRSD